MWLIGGVAAAVVLVGGGVAVASRGGDDNSNSAAPDAGSSSAAADATPSDDAVAVDEPTLEELQPTGVWDLNQDGTKEIHRDGSRKAVTFDPATWTITPIGCTATECNGTIKSSGGAEYTYVWSGTEMILHRDALTEPKAACVDTASGQPKPIEEAAAIARTTYKYPTFVVTLDADGVPTTLTGASKSTTKYRFFGTCEPSPKDVVGYAGPFTVTRQP